MADSIRSTDVPAVHGLVALNPDGSAIGTPVGGATASNQTDGSQKTQIVDAGGEVATVTGGKLDVNASVDTTGLALDATLTGGTQKSQLVDSGGEAVTVTSGKLDVNASIDTTGLATTTTDTNTGTIAGDTTSIDAKIPALGQALATASVPVVLTAAQITTLTPPAAITGFATETTLASIKDTDGIKKITDALPTGTNSIGKISDITTSITPGTAAANLGKAEDAGHTSGDVGVMMLAVRNEGHDDFSGIDKDYIPIAVDATGDVYTWIRHPIASGTNVIGKVGIDQTTPGTTNKVTVGADVVHTIVDSGAVTTSGTVTEANSAAIKTSVELIDNAVSGAGFNITQIGSAAAPIGAGLEATAVRVTLPTDGTGKVTAVSGTAANMKVAATLDAETTKVIGTIRVASGGIASGSIASGAIASGAIASGAAVSGAFADGSNVTLGAKADAKSTATDGTAVTIMQVLKEISAMEQAPASRAVTNTGTFVVQATLAAETTKVIGTVNQGTSPWVTSNATTSVVGNGAAATAQRVTLANDSTGIIATVGAVTAITNALPAGTNLIGDVDVAPRTTGGWSVGNYTSGDTYTALTNGAQVIKASAGKFGGYYIYNPNTATIYVMIYNIAAASVTVGTSTAKLVFCIPASGGANLELLAGIPFDTAMSIAAATTGGGNTAPTTALEAMIFYK